MHRFYSANADFSYKHLNVSDFDEIHHIKDVLHLKVGAVIQIFNAKHEEADVKIESISDRGMKVLVLAVREAVVKKSKIILACAPPKKDKFEWIIEKCTELGVDEIIPLKTKRSEVIFTAERMVGKLARYQKVAMNASKQSKRVALPTIHPMLELAEVLKNLDPKGVHLFPSLNGKSQHIKEALKTLTDTQTVTIFIGPEGDFTPQEVEMAIQAGCVPISLGETVLKVETAAIATVSFVRFLREN